LCCGPGHKRGNCVKFMVAVSQSFPTPFFLTHVVFFSSIVGENSMPLPIRILYSIQDPSSVYATSACGVDEDDVESSSFIPCCFEMNMPSSGLLKAHDILAAFPPAGVAAEVGR